MKVTAKARRSGDWWAIEVPEIPCLFTQAKRLDQVVEMVSDAGELAGYPQLDVVINVVLAGRGAALIADAKAR